MSRKLRAEDLGDGQEGAIARGVPVGLVEQPEPVDIDERDADRSAGRPRAFDGEGQLADERAVVEQAGQRVASGRIDEGDGPPGDPTLCGAEDQEQGQGGDECRDQGRDDDVAAESVELGEDRHGIAPDADDGLDAAACLEREVFAEDTRCRKR